MTQSPDLTALLGSRICHDLISPVGAIANGVELLQMSGMENSPELALISDSVETANARIRLFRIAFGAPSGQPVQASEIKEIVTPMQSAKRIAVDWSPEAGRPRSEVRLAFLLLLCGETLLPWGGEIAVAAGESGIRLDLRGKRIKEIPELLGRLESPSEAELLAGDLHFEIARRAAEDLNWRISVSRGETDMRLAAG